MGKMKNLKIKRAIISVYDKEGIIPLAKSLEENGVEIFSTGGTYKKITEAGITAVKIEDLTKFPEIMGGRVKTLHPVIFSGILADSSNSDHLEDLKSVNVEPFQLIVVNLYPFSEAYHSEDSTDAQIIEMIDIGGPSMLRASAKNYNSVAVLSNPGQYDEFLKNFENDEICLDYRRELAKSVFVNTALYDSEIATYFSESKDSMPDFMFKNYEKSHKLRYGENPDQPAAIYAPVSDKKWEPFEQLHGKVISYNNYIDCFAAYKIIEKMGMDTPICANIKHTNPCGFGTGTNGVEAYKRAVKTDPVSYFGGIVCTNTEIDQEFAEQLVKSFLECIIGPGFTDEALAILKKKKNLRILIPYPEALRSEMQFSNYGTGLLVQELQFSEEDESNWQIVTDRKPYKEIMQAIRIGWNLVKSVKSNAIVLADESGALGIGAGQMSRVDSMKIALRKSKEAGLSVEHSIIASDAFFPFRDSIDLAAENNIAGVIQPGGSIRDQEVIDACNEHNIFMIFTGKRVFKH